MIDLNEMATFERVVRDGSFTAAAESLGLAKSTVSTRIARLEARLGVRLLSRTTRQVRPTEDGRAYFERCQRVVTAAREADELVTHARAVPHGLLRVSAPRLFGYVFLAPVLDDFLARFRDVRVDLVLVERLVDMVEEGFDLAIRVGRLDDSSLIARRLGLGRMKYVASPAYLEARGQPERPQDLADHDLLVVTRTGRASWPFATPQGMHARPVEGRVVINSTRMALELAVNGQGVAFLPEFLAADALMSGALDPVLAEFDPPPMPIHAVYPSSRHVSAKVRAFLDVLVAHVTAHPALQ